MEHKTCVLINCGKKPIAYFCSTEHAVIDYLKSHGTARIIELINEYNENRDKYIRRNGFPTEEFFS